MTKKVYNKKHRERCHCDTSIQYEMLLVLLWGTCIGQHEMILVLLEGTCIGQGCRQMRIICTPTTRRILRSITRLVFLSLLSLFLLVNILNEWINEQICSICTSYIFFSEIFLSFHWARNWKICPLFGSGFFCLFFKKEMDQDQNQNPLKKIFTDQRLNTVLITIILSTPPGSVTPLARALTL